MSRAQHQRTNTKAGLAQTYEVPAEGRRFLVWEPQTWHEAIKAFGSMPGWLFRGQRDARWPLTTSFERTMKQYRFPAVDPVAQEEEVLNQFKRRAHHYLHHIPRDDDNLEWLSILQHYGGPTRLLDFTRSFYVAAFFAIEDAQRDRTDDSDDPVVWAVNQHLLDIALLRAGLLPESASIPQKGEAKVRLVEACLPRSPHCRRPRWQSSIRTKRFLCNPNVITIRPWRLNERMGIQHGWFLFPTRLDATFQQNLCNTLGVPGTDLPEKDRVPDASTMGTLLKDPANNNAIVKIRLRRDIHGQCIGDLYRMNITAATLLPGIDGLARSLQFLFRGYEDLALEDQDAANPANIP